MSDWLFDLGNSRLKFCAWRPGLQFGDMQAVAHASESEMGALPDDVAGEVAWVATVASDERRHALLQALRPRFARIGFARSSTRFDGLQVAYPQPERLGIDRFLALLAAERAGIGPVLVVGVGTALTIDLLGRDGRHAGGLIAPSPTLMRESLHGRSARLPASGGRRVGFADDTDDALASGCEGAAIALVRAAMVDAVGRLGEPPSLWLHGGGAAQLSPALPSAEYRPALVLQGLADWVGGAAVAPGGG